ncbi:MAG: hypothetical protein DDT36_01602 [Firmicutes bacterium]|nr:hypothetical protein [Bacillota bacterium]
MGSSVYILVNVAQLPSVSSIGRYSLEAEYGNILQASDVFILAAHAHFCATTFDRLLALNTKH